MTSLLSIALALTPFAAGPQEGTPEAVPVDPLAALEGAIDAAVGARMETDHLPGAAVVVVQEGRTVFLRGYGQADLSSGRAVDPERTLFRIGSVTKALTGLAVTRQVDRGRLAWDDRADGVLDAIDDRTGVGRSPTLWNLVTHTSGFDQIGGPQRHEWSFHLPYDERLPLRPSLAEFLGNDQLRQVSPAGELMRYDTYGITLAGLALARAVDLPYREAMRRELFAPLGMEHSYVEAQGAAREDLAVGYGWVDGEYVAQPYEMWTTTPASSIDATPADMGRLLEALTADGANAHGRLLSPASNAAVLSPQYRAHPRFAGITHGLWESTSFRGAEGPALHSVGHGGSALGFWTSFEVFTESRVGVLTVTNRDAEAGGGWIHLGGDVTQAVVDTLIRPEASTAWLPAAPDRELDLDGYAGDYVYGVFCHSCTDAELARGAWRRRDPIRVRSVGGGLQVGDERYLPTAEDDVFVHDSGAGEVFFGRDAGGAISFFVRSSDPNAFERVGG